MCSSRPPTRHARHRRRAAVGMLALLALGLGACGKKGAPEPPLRFIPRAASDLAVQQRGSELFLRFAYPSVATNGMALPGLASVELWQAARPVPESSPPQPPEPRQFQGAAEIAASLSGDELTASVTGDRVVVRWPVTDAGAEPRLFYTFAVRFVSTRGERSDFSNLASIAPLPPPQPLTELQAEARADGIEVAWKASGAEAEAEAYRVYRRGAEERSYGDPLSTVAAGQERFLDATARFGNRYIYTVTAVVASDPVVESALGAEREIDYRDRFPPPPPTELVALAEAGQIRLSWRASEGGDAAGYHVYRRDEPRGEHSRLTTEPVTATRFLDTGLTAGQTYSYRVTAVDASGNESSPGEAVEATAR